MPKLRKMLGAADSPYILSLMKLIDTQSKATIARWCMDYCEEHILPIFEKHCPGDKMEAALRAVAVVNEPNPARINWGC